MDRPTSSRDVEVFVKEASSVVEGEAVFPEVEEASEVALDTACGTKRSMSGGILQEGKCGAEKELHERLQLNQILRPKSAGEEEKADPTRSSPSSREVIRRVSDQATSLGQGRNEKTSSEEVSGADKVQCSTGSYVEENEDAAMTMMKAAVAVATKEETPDEDICCICLEEYTDENPILYGECKHHFHLPCLMEWKQRSNVCPMCASESLRGLADDSEPPPDTATNDDAFIALLLQRQLERYAQRHGRLQRQRERSHGRVREAAAASAERRPPRNSVSGQAQHIGNTVAVQRSLGGRSANANVVANPTLSGGASTPGEALRYDYNARTEHRVENERLKEGGVATFFRRFFCCSKR
ncbi:putative E3 ubiquitin-protein ligase [Trypanosoma grayi]|uniref:putative E3 ubiquitin-protein ligase n=1 Tax=Trypanosoma grayi TaxID=71804 RepID=UPI0004F3F142|nr:putative E3 ubiquitin-protein ligase [Trypanosoma grayi]KEG08527.1 putative E3 ubiquitin-protein ligase [Trypanosoma grayi]